MSACIHERKGHPSVDKQRRVEIAVQADTEYLVHGNLDGAHRHLSRAVELNPRHAPAYNVFALLYLREGDLKKTEKNYKKAIKHDDGFAPALNNYGAFLYGQGRYEEAFKYLSRVVKDVSYDKRYQAYENLGLVSLALKNEKAAIDAFQNTIRLVNDTPRANLELAEIYLNRGNEKIAERYYSIFLTHASQTARSLWLGIQIVQKTGNENAKASYVLALKNLFPNSVEYKRYKELMDR